VIGKTQEKVAVSARIDALLITHLDKEKEERKRKRSEQLEHSLEAHFETPEGKRFSITKFKVNGSSKKTGVITTSLNKGLVKLLQEEAKNSHRKRSEQIACILMNYYVSEGVLEKA